jgi:hypothetical protein
MNRRTTAAACLTAAPVLVSASHFLWPANSEGTDTQQIVAAGAHAGSWAAATVVETIGWLLFVPGLIGLWNATTDRGRRLTTIGVWASIAGMFGYYGAGVMNLVTIEFGRRHDPIAMATLMHALKHNNTMFWMLVAPLLLGTLALVVAFAGVARSRLVGWWAPAAVFVGLVASQFLSESDNAVLLTVAFAPLIIACIATAARLGGLRPDTAPVADTAAYATA